MIITDCCMESIYCNTKIPAVTVRPERDYWIFLNWSSIHLSIKKRVTQTPGTKVQCQVHLKHLRSPIEPLQPYFKRAYFWNFIIPVIPCFYISHCIRFFWHPSYGNSELCEGLEPTMFSFYPPWATLRTPGALMTSSGQPQKCKCL